MKAFALALERNGLPDLGEAFDQPLNVILCKKLAGIRYYDVDPETGVEIPASGGVTETGWAVFLVASLPNVIDDLDKENDAFVLLTTLTEPLPDMPGDYRPELLAVIPKKTLDAINAVYGLVGKEAIKPKKKDPNSTPVVPLPDLDKTIGDVIVELMFDVLDYPPPVTEPILHAAFSMSTSSGQPPLTVTFTDKSVAATSWSWDFDDKSPVSTVQNPVHTFAEEGSYKVKLEVADATGKKDKAVQIVNVFVPVEVP